MNGVAADLRRAARLLPRGAGLRHGLRLPRSLMAAAGRAGHRPGVASLTVGADVGVRLHGSGRGALLWIHGGGYVMGTAQQEDAFCARLAAAAGITVVAVDHRLAPEHPYPTPLEDCYTALRWLSQQPWVDASRIAVGGASAGGGLAAALALLARDRGEVPLAFQALVYPMLDDRTDAAPAGVGRILWTAADNRRAWRWYLGDADPSVAVPARRRDLAGLPPAWLGVGTLDLFCAEDLAYSRRLRQAGVPAVDHLAIGAFHAFDQVAPAAPIAREFFDSLVAQLRLAIR